MKLIVTKRAGEQKSELNTIRRRGDIPAILYQDGKPGDKIVVNGIDIERLFRQLKTGYLPTQVFEVEYEGKTFKAIVKEIQYEPTSYKVIHLDFLVLDEKTEVEVKVPLNCSGEDLSPGIKLGGFMRQVKRHVPVRCLPSKMPLEFNISISDLALNQSKRVKDIEMPEGVVPLLAANDVVVAVAKR